MLILDDEGERATALAERLHGLARGAGRLPAREAAVAAARHGAAVPGASGLQPKLPRAGNSCSVRRGCLHLTTASRRGGVRSTGSSSSGIDDLGGMKMDREQALDVALGQIERKFGKGAVMKMSDQAHVSVGVDLDRLAVARPRPRHRRPAARPHRRDLRPGVVGQDDARLPRDRRGPAPRRHLRLHRRRARDGPDVREADRRQHRRPARLAARHRRAGARDRRAAGPLRRARRRRDRLGRRAHAEGRDRGRDGRLARRPAGAADVAGAPQARRHAQPHRHDLHLHEPAAREDRRDVRQPRDDAGRPRAEVLLVGPPRHPPHRDAQGRRRGGRQPRAASRW